jgi:hypothetical protein
VSAEDIRKIEATVQVIEQVTALPAYRQRALAQASEICLEDHGPLGAFMGYDFHLTESGPKLIEINTNAGGAFLNAILAEAQLVCCQEMGVPREGGRLEKFVEQVARMFRDEWFRQNGDRPIGRIAIVDDSLHEQYLYPEFVLARQLLRSAGLDTEVVDARQLTFDGDRLFAEGKEIGLVYNRLVDFDLSRPEHLGLREAYVRGSVVLTPNPHNHALLADKRNLALLSNAELLGSWGLASEVRDLLLATIPKTLILSPENADALWNLRKDLFFKPSSGHGGKAVYRGDKITRGVWSEIVKGEYVAQESAQPSERVMRIDGKIVSRKLDIRLYTYAGRTLLAAARVYQGQTTNMRTPGGGFAPVFAV